MIFLKHSSIILAAFLLIYFVEIVSGAIENVAKDKTVSRRSSPSAKGSNDISVIVDGDRDGVIAEVDNDTVATNNSLTECIECYISTSTDVDMWIRINLVEKYFVTKVNVFTGNVFVIMNRINILTRSYTGNVNPVNDRNDWKSVYYGSSEYSEWNADIRPASYSLYVAVVRESAGGLTLSEVEVFGYAPADFKPRNLKLSQTLCECVRLDWDNPYTDVEANYQYSCGTSSWKSTGSNTYGTVCGLTPAVGLQCSVRVDDVTQTVIHEILQYSVKKCISKNKAVSRGFAPSIRGSNDISVIVDGDRDGKITATPIDPDDITNSLTECTACYISTSTNVNTWIRIDLVDKHFVTEINVFTGSQFVAISRINILTKPEIGNVHPVNNKNSWNSVYYDGSHSLSEWNVDIRPASYSRYVAVVRESSGGLTLSEVEVFGYAPADFKPRNLKLSQTSSDCVRLDWDNPYTDVEANYQYSCGTSSWMSLGSNTYGTVCGLTSAVSLQCSVRVDDVTQTEVHENLQCSVVQPDDITFGTGSKIQNGGRWRYQYSVSWEVPSTYTSCVHPSSPYRVEIDSTTETKVVNNYNKESYTVYGDSEDTITVGVQIRNKDGDLSFPADKSLTVPIGLPPQVAPRNFKLTAESPYCVSLSYDPVLYPNGPESGLVYQYNCNSDGWKNIPSDKQVCEFTPNTLVNCEIRARRESNSNSNKDSEIATDSETTCNTPTVPEYSTVYSTQTHIEKERISLNLTWEESFSSCASISHYDLTIKLNEQQIFYKRYSAEEDREKVLEDLDPYTNYTIILIAVNNAFYQSSAEPRYITTPELAPYDGPSLSIDFNTNCAHLTIQDPAQPNGIITEYQYICYYPNSEEGNYQSILATDKQPVSLCEFRSAEKVTCSTKAINSAGESPVTSQTGYTRIAVIQSDKVEVKVTETIQKSFTITIHQVTLDNKSPDSYVFVVQKETSTSKRKKRSPVQLPSECDLDPDCYITAEIESSLVDSDGYDFRVGDGKTYRDYYNAPLEPNQDYKIYQAVTVQTEDGFTIVEYLNEPIRVSLGMNENHCSAPPLVENSRLLSSDESWGVGTLAQYSCEEGFHITGQSEIVCGDDNGVVDWSGELPECRKLGHVIGLSVGISIGVLMITIVILIIVTLRKSRSQTSNRETQPKLQKGDNLEDIGLSSIQRASTDVPEYAEVPVDKNPAPTYESMNTVTEDHNYEKVVHTVHNLSPNTNLYQNMHD